MNKIKSANYGKGNTGGVVMISSKALSLASYIGNVRRTELVPMVG